MQSYLTVKTVGTEYCRSQMLNERSSRKGKGEVKITLGINEVGYQTPL